MKAPAQRGRAQPAASQPVATISAAASPLRRAAEPDPEKPGAEQGPPISRVFVKFGNNLNEFDKVICLLHTTYISFILD